MNKQIYYLPKPLLFSFSECLWFLDRGFDECLYRVDKTQVIRAVQINGDSFLFSISEHGDNLAITVLVGKPDASQQIALLNYVTDWFDLKTDLQPFYKLLSASKKLAYMCKEFNGLRLIGMPDLFEALCWSIIGQQINLSFAYKLKRQMVEAYGERLVYEGNTYYLIPGPARLAQLTVPELRVMQFSDKKAEYIITISKAFADGKLSKTILQALPNLESKQKLLISFKGIGIWTANYALMKSLREPASIPYGDVGILNALQNHGIIDERSQVEKIERFFGRFKGWESYVVSYLWRSLTKRV